jgi:hypothetical protein
MNGYDSIAWLPLCFGLTVIGVILSWVAWRRRGAAAGLRGLAWSLLPVAAYLTGAVRLVWEVGTSVARWLTRFVFSPTVWAGVVVAGVAVLLFVISGALRGRTLARGRAVGKGEVEGTTPKAGKPAARREVAKRGSGGDDDEFSEVEEILRRRGIS